MEPLRNPLPILLSHILLAFERDYDMTDAELPSLPVLSNLLRVLDPAGVDIKALPELGRVSTRAIRIATQSVEQDGWLTIKSVKRGLKSVALTSVGERLRAAGFARLEATEAAWRKRFGESEVQRLHDALAALVGRLALELPHYPSGYGQGDTSIHGGSYVGGDEGPPRIPSHGAEWPVVVREARGDVDQLPLSALLSQALCAFAIDYDSIAESELAGLHTVLTYLRYANDDGMPLKQAKALGGVTGTGRSSLERHLLVTVKSGVAYLTEHGARVRDRYPLRVVEIEEDWKKAYGKKLVQDLRGVLEHFDEKINVDVPDYVDVSGWLQRRG
ncbi:MAG: hypothetical protein AAF512_05435 [Pseudomonadota bacterium]